MSEPPASYRCSRKRDHEDEHLSISDYDPKNKSQFSKYPTSKSFERSITQEKKARIDAIVIDQPSLQSKDKLSSIRESGNSKTSNISRAIEIVEKYKRKSTDGSIHLQTDICESKADILIQDQEESRSNNHMNTEIKGSVEYELTPKIPVLTKKINVAKFKLSNIEQLLTGSCTQLSENEETITDMIGPLVQPPSYLSFPIIPLLPPLMYQGPISRSSGLPNGFGRIFTVPPGELTLYIGSLKEGKYSGYGVLNNLPLTSKEKIPPSYSLPPPSPVLGAPLNLSLEGARWARYAGMFKEGKRHGVGRLDLIDGTIFEGEWNDGEASGYGLFKTNPKRGITVAGKWDANSCQSVK